NPLYANLASRYFYESEQNEFGLKFLDAMIQGAKSSSVKKSYEMRKQALISVLQIEEAVSSYRNRFGRFPTELTELVQTGLLAKLPDDPYGGTFFLDEQGKVRTSSKFVAPVAR
ncbi:MAG: hypothetical protein J7L69_11030, partial [Desulfobulbaceae bacterium]|nr:hypothetical protein [Desulfobulbaceae bacterium]